MAKQQRKQQLVDQPVQRALVMMVIRQWLLFVAGTLLFLFFAQVCLGEPHASLSTHLQSMWQHYSLAIIPMFLLGPVFINDYIKLSNRFAGPMLRIRRELRKLAQGQSARPVELRKQDFWHDVARDFNVVLDMVERHQPAATAEAEQACGNSVQDEEPLEVAGV